MKKEKTITTPYFPFTRSVLYYGHYTTDATCSYDFVEKYNGTLHCKGLAKPH